jgi:hypothetical protein
VLLVKPANEKFTHPFPAHTAPQPQHSYSSHEKETRHVRAPRSPVGTTRAPLQEAPPLLRHRPFCCRQTPQLQSSINITAIGHPRRCQRCRSSAATRSLHLFCPSHRYITPPCFWSGHLGTRLIFHGLKICCARVLLPDRNSQTVPLYFFCHVVTSIDNHKTKHGPSH